MLPGIFGQFQSEFNVTTLEVKNELTGEDAH
jgi:hypothetical protein